MSGLPQNASTGSLPSLGQRDPVQSGVVVWAAMFLLHILGACLLTMFLAVRIRREDFRSLSNLRQISVPRLLLVLQFFCSWLFFVITGVIEQGVGLFISSAACAAGIYTCLGLYSLCKLLVFLFFAERVRIVWSPSLGDPRYKSPVWIICMVAVVAYVGIVCHLFFIVISYLQPDGQCFVGLQLDGAILLVIFDAIISILLTSLFVWPLWRHKFHSSQLKRTAWRSVVAAAITLSTSCVNISVLAGQGGVEHGWVFVVCWGSDLLIGSTAFFWATSGTGLRPMTSMLASAKHFEETQTRHHQRRWFRVQLSKPEKTPSFVSPKPDFARQVSLPTIMTHGYASTGDTSTSDSASVISIPRSVSISRSPMWSSILATQRLHAGELTPDHEIGQTCAFDEKQYAPEEI